MSFLVDGGVAASLPDAAYRYCRHEPGADVILTGTGSEAHLLENLASIQRADLPARSSSAGGRAVWQTRSPLWTMKAVARQQLRKPTGKHDPKRRRRRAPNAPSACSLDSAELAATYDLVSVRQFNHGKILIAELGLKSGERVLDIGCGTGRLGAYVADLSLLRARCSASIPCPCASISPPARTPLQGQRRSRRGSLRLRRRELRRCLCEQRFSLGCRQAQGPA